MPSITAVAANALRIDEARVERVASNVANATTPGYKREMLIEGGLPSSREAAFSRVFDAAEGNAPEAPSSDGYMLARDQRPGTLAPTGGSLDLAIGGPGFFELNTEKGPVYTRAGRFHVDAGGRLVNAQGYGVMGAGGEISLSSDHVAIDAAGRITDGTATAGQLRLVDWRDGELTTIGNGLFVGSGSSRQVEDGDLLVRQGHLENANVDTAHEMVELMATMRHFESMLRIVQQRDELDGTAIRKLGEL